MGERLRLMAVHAHPDDESSKGAATMARYVAEGVDVLVVTCTGGERGDVLNPRAAARPDDPARHRRGPPRTRWPGRAEILGVQHDVARLRRLRAARGRPAAAAAGGLLRARAARGDRRGRWSGSIREFRPHVMTTYDENGGYPHPDHIMCHTVSMAAFERRRRPRALPARGRAVAAAEALLQPDLQPGPDRRVPRGDARGRGLESPYAEWLERLGGPRRARPITTRVECADVLRRRATRRCSRTPPRSTPTAAGSGAAGDAAARSGRPRTTSWRCRYVPVSPPEDDLFAGLGSPEEATAMATSTGLRIAYDGTGDES